MSKRKSTSSSGASPVKKQKAITAFFGSKNKPADNDIDTSFEDITPECSTLLEYTANGFDDRLRTLILEGKRVKIAAFDLDGTIIEPLQGRVRPRDETDWKIRFPNCISRLKGLLDKDSVVERSGTSSPDAAAADLRSLSSASDIESEEEDDYNGGETSESGAPSAACAGKGSNVPKQEDAFVLLIFSNQHAVSKGKPPPKVFCAKIKAICTRLSLPLLVLAATLKDQHRKPCRGMWDRALEHVQRVIDGLDQSEKVDAEDIVDLKKSFYVGDAAGRPNGGVLRVTAKNKGRKDHSCSDRKFALNVGLNFFTPETFFFGQDEAPFELGGFDPFNDIEVNGTESSFKALKDRLLDSSVKPEMILLSGYPGSGKTTLFNRVFKGEGYIHINRDTIGSKCEQAAKEALQMAQSVCIDNTNPSREARRKYIAIASKLKIPVRCAVLNVSKALCEHLNTMRWYGHIPGNAVPQVAYSAFEKYHQQVDISEGFTEVVHVDFVPHFDDEAHKSAFLAYY